MFSFFKKKKSLLSSGLFEGYTDGHSHILPGVDDGIQGIQESLDTLSLYASMGVRNVWLTPHTMEDIPNTTAQLTETYNTLLQRWQSECPQHSSLSIHLSSEYMLDPLFIKHLECKDLLPYGPKRDHLLVETSYYNAPVDFLPTLASIKQSGLQPILAHPERYAYMNDSDYETLKQHGIKFQLNITSLIGYYGPDAQQRARKLLSLGYYNLSGSDIHSLSRFENAINHRALKSQDLDLLTTLPSL